MLEITQKDLDKAKADGQLTSDILYIKEKVDNIETKLQSNYITKEEFAPVKQLVYGMVSLILVAVVGALVTLVIKR